MTRHFKLTGFNTTNTPNQEEIDGYEIQHAVVLSDTRDGGDTVLVKADDDEIAEFQFEDDSFWMGTVGELPLILQNDSAPASRGFNDGEIEIPASISFGSDDRGGLKNIVLKVFKIFKPKGNITGAIVKKSAEFLDNRIQPAPGLFYVDAEFRTTKVTNRIKETTQPYLLLMHGTAASLQNSFHKMVEFKQFGLWENLKQTYGDRILALEHQTLTKSPFENAIEVIKWLPKKVQLHIISTSRGGLVGEIIAKYCDIQKPGFLPEHREQMAEDFGENIIKKFETEISGREITIEKYIRVACPGAGTTLCSTRLDLYLNVLINGINMAFGGTTSPILSAFKKLLADVLACKARPNILPGLYVMNPNSKFIAALNHPQEVINGSLHVIAGNNKIALKPKAIITIITKLFYRGKNDWIVDTKSMSRGLFRKQNIGYFYHEGADVNHFSYFANRETQQATNSAINAPINTIAPEFESFDRSLPKNVDRGVIFGNLKPKTVSGKKPVIVFIPGILGSNLAKNNDEIYLDIVKIAFGKITELTIDASNVKATSLIGRFYNKFEKEFSNDYDVAVFPYDWRLNMKGEAEKLNTYINNILTIAKGKTIKIVAHSMGGLVLREFMDNHSVTWKKVTAFADYKVLFLGSPLGGSYLIPEILVGKGGRLKQLAGLDLLHSKEKLLHLFNTYDGILSLLPIDTTAHDFTDVATWKKMKQHFVSVNWPIPDDITLKKFSTFHKKVSSFDTTIYNDKNFIYIAGKSEVTVNGFYYNLASGNEDKLIFTGTPFGDGSVTWASGIPKEIKENDRVYYTMVGHGDLANAPDIFDGIREILKTGKTNLLSKQLPVSRGEKPVFDMPEQLVEDLTLENVENVMLGATKPETVYEEIYPPITIEMKCGDLRYATYPIIVGHLRSDGIMSAEKVVDFYFNNLLSKRLATGNYPGNIGESKYFSNPNRKPLGALIVGMGKTEKLSGYQLEETVKQGVIEYLCSFNKKDSGSANSLGISSLLLGCGYSGLSVETAIKAIVSGVHKANETIRNNGDKVWPVIDKIEFIEIFEDRALQALICLDQLKNNTSAKFNFEPKLQKLIGSRKRLNFENNIDWWQRITIQSDFICNENDTRTKVFTFSSSMGTAREEVRKLYCSKEIIETLINEISTKQNWDGELAKIIFELLIPNDFKMAVRNQQNLLLILDKTTAGYPWEMLQDISIQSSPLSTQVGMIRQLSTEVFRPGVNYTLANRALIIGNPDTGNFLPTLPGAADEAQLVNKLLSEIGYETTASINESSSTIIKKMFRSDYKIMHLAGHGIFNEENPELSGMVIGNDVFLTTKEIEQLSSVPELVFINCCHLGSSNVAVEKASQFRYKLAANLGTQLIEMGVKVVVAAGWAINDQAAMEFTSDFYSEMLDGKNFGEAIKNARCKCYERYPSNNTWGAYQCYGDQFYTLKKLSSAKKVAVKNYYVVEQVKLDLENLINKIGANYSAVQKEGYLQEFNDTINGAKASNILLRQLTELIAIFYNRIGEEKTSLEYFTEYFEKNSNDFNLNSYVEYSRLKINYYLKQPIAIKEIKKVISKVESLNKIITAHALYNVLGSAYKTLASLYTGKQRVEYIQSAVINYVDAFTLGKSSSVDNTMYSISNAFMLNELLPKNAVVMPAITELEWSFNNIEVFDNMLTFWDLMDEPRYWLCKFILQHQGHIFPNGNNKITIDRVVQSIQQVFISSGEETQKMNIVMKLRVLFELFDIAKFKSLQVEFKKILDILEHEQ